MNFLYKWLPIIFGCHCRDDRSFYFHNKKFPICARCTGEFTGILTGLITYCVWHINWKMAFLILLPMVADGFLQALTTYESNNTKRFITGFLFGYGLAVLFVCSTVFTFDFGKNLGNKIILK